MERIAGLLDLLARPDESYPIIHIAGTNGKTSTSRMIAALVSAHGLDAGLFTSPHLDAVEHRYELSGFPMTPAEFAEAMAMLAPIADLYAERSGDRITYFELTAGLAFLWFADRAVDVAVLETGLGGRWDATNAATSEVAVVTNIDLEHTEYLGDTIAAIAAEKLAILDPGADLVTGDLHPDALAVAADRAREQEARWFRFGEEFRVVAAEPSGRGWRIDLSGIHGEYPDLDLHLHGRHQVTNFAVAVAAVEAFLDRSLDVAAVRETANLVTSPGRMEVLRRDPLLLTDGGHNPAGMAALGAALNEEFAGVRWALVFGAMRDKDVVSMLGALSGRVDAAHVAAAESPRAMPVGELAALVTERLGVPVTGHGSVASAVAAAIDAGGPVLVTGSIYVVGEARRALGVSTPLPSAGWRASDQDPQPG